MNFGFIFLKQVFTLLLWYFKFMALFFYKLGTYVLLNTYYFRYRLFVQVEHETTKASGGNIKTMNRADKTWAHFWKYSILPKKN